MILTHLVAFKFFAGASASGAEPEPEPTAVTLGAGGGRYRYWAPTKEPKKRKKREEKIAVIEAVVSTPVAHIDLSALSEQIKAALEVSVPDYRAIVTREQAKPSRDLEADRFKAEAEAIAEEAKTFVYYRDMLAEESKLWEEARKQRRKELFSKKRERNRRIIQMLLH